MRDKQPQKADLAGSGNQIEPPKNETNAIRSRPRDRKRMDKAGATQPFKRAKALEGPIIMTREGLPEARPLDRHNDAEEEAKDNPVQPSKARFAPLRLGTSDVLSSHQLEPNAPLNPSQSLTTKSTSGGLGAIPKYSDGVDISAAQKALKAKRETENGISIVSKSVNLFKL